MELDNKITTAQHLAAKLDKLNTYFDVTTSTVDELTTYIEKTVPDEPSTESILENENENILIPLSLLKKDFYMIRDTLIETISSGKTVIKELATKLQMDEGATNGSVISAYAELVGVINNSLKLLTSSYKDILELQKIVNNTKEDPKSLTINGDITVGMNLSDTIREMKKANSEEIIVIEETK